MTDQDFLTIRQAAKWAGVHDKTIRRLIERIANGTEPNAAADRYHVLPSATDKEQGTNEPWRINLALLRTKYPDVEKQAADDGEGESTTTVDRLIKVIERQAESQSKTIEKLEEKLEDTTQRLETAAVEIDSLKQELLEGPKSETKAESVDDENSTEEFENEDTKKLRSRRFFGVKIF